jgi:hypothetical protein
VGLCSPNIAEFLIVYLSSFPYLQRLLLIRRNSKIQIEENLNHGHLTIDFIHISDMHNKNDAFIPYFCKNDKNILIADYYE